MSRFRQVKHPEDPQLKSIYRAALDAGFAGHEQGVPSNFVTSLSERPDILEVAMTLIKRIVLEGQLPPTVKQMIAMTIAMQNNCNYCARMHSSALEAMGVPGRVIESCASDPGLAELPPPQRAIVQFALKTSRDPLAVSDGDVESLREIGLSDGEIIEVAAMAAAENFLNTWSRVSRIPIDGEA